MEFFKAIIDFVSFYNIVLMAGAMILGIVVGTLPGLSATIGIALLTGITYSFQKSTAMIMMMINSYYLSSLIFKFLMS